MKRWDFSGLRFSGLRLRRAALSPVRPGWGLVAVLLLPLAGLLLLLAFHGGGEDREEHYVLYFPERFLAAGTGALRAVPSELAVNPSADPRMTAVSLAEELLLGPRDEGLRSAFPAGTALRSLELSGGRVAVDFSGTYSTLSGVALTLADYSVALTLTQIPEISLVRITVQGQELAYRDRQSFTARDVLLDPETDVVGTVDALIFFPSSEGVLVPERRTLPLYEGDTQVEAVTEAVEGGPENRDLLPAFPEGFRVRSVWQEGNLCFVNLSSALLDALPPEENLSPALSALDKSLCSLENVEEVRYLVDGEFLAQYGAVKLGEPY